MFALSLHASVPTAATRAQFDPGSVRHNLDLTAAQQRLPITAAPADNISFYIEFYGNQPVAEKPPRKPGLFRRMTIALKKTVQKVSLIPN